MIWFKQKRFYDMPEVVWHKLSKCCEYPNSCFFHWRFCFQICWEMNLAEGRDLLVWTRNGKPPLGTPIPSSYSAGRRRLNPAVRDGWSFPTTNQILQSELHLSWNMVSFRNYNKQKYLIIQRKILKKTIVFWNKQENHKPAILIL